MRFPEKVRPFFVGGGRREVFFEWRGAIKAIVLIENGLKERKLGPLVKTLRVGGWVEGNYQSPSLCDTLVSCCSTGNPLPLSDQ